MERGKQTCKILKAIHKQIAEANDIEFITSECQYQGDCPGTCYKCETEVFYLELQLNYRRMAGQAISILGISAGMLTSFPALANAQQPKFMQINELAMIQDSVWEKGDGVLNELTLSSNVLFGDIQYCIPEFSRGISSFYRYLEKNFRYPEINNEVKGQMIVSFKILKNGNIDDVQIIHGIHSLLDKEALRVIKTMPKWISGKILVKQQKQHFIYQ